jgi:hypothetical protein
MIARGGYHKSRGGVLPEAVIKACPQVELRSILRKFRNGTPQDTLIVLGDPDYPIMNSQETRQI